jgi:hypothetical protein
MTNVYARMSNETRMSNERRRLKLILWGYNGSSIGKE